jgi:diguanylate cyclase (GGDEF)-like protein
MADATGGGDELAEEYRVVRPTSEVRWVFARGQATRDTAGTIVGLRGICQDITERKRGEEALRHHANLLQILQGIAMAANEAATLEAALAFCLSDICRHTGFSVARVTFVDPLGEPATGGFHHTEDPELAAVLDFPATHLLPGSEALVAAVLAERAPVWVVDLAAGVPSRDCRIRAGFAFPVSVGAEVAAVLEFFAREPADPDQQLMEAMTAAGVQLGRVLERTRAEESLSYRALHDPLTGLPNRALFLDRLNHALVRRDRLTRKTAVLFLDLDGFKDVNDSLGHEAGDALLVVLAGRLQGILRPSDTVARFGGDEFTILCEGLVEEDVALEIAARVADVVAVPVTLGGVQEVVISTSVGIAFARSPADTAEGLLRDADMAMYRAKELGRARYAIFDVTLHARAARRLETVTALRRAVELHQLGLFYQPVVSLPDGRMVGTEALIRWRHPERGLLGPGEFISLAEESQLIVPIGNWVLEEACRQAVEWQKANAGARPLELSVNVSARQLTYGGLVEAIDLALSTSGIDPHLLCLEITESVLMADADFYLEAMLGLKCLDVRLAVDDFGMGYSSLAYLKRFPIDVLKIDKAFVDGLGRDDSRSAAIVGAILDLAAALELTAVAEGVETLEQASDLEAMGCPRAQGYYFARPEPPEALARLIGGAPLPAAARPG